MKFFDNLINDFYQLCDGHSFALRKYCEDDICPCDDHLQVIMQRDTAFELEGMGFEFVTSSTVSDSVVVLGDDLQNINANTKFARVCIIGINDTADEQSVHNVIKKIEYEKYKFFPKGYMMRASVGDKAEKVRVSKKLIRDKVSFYNIGNAYINKLKSNPNVRGVSVYFITENTFDFSTLQRLSQKNTDIVKTLDHVMSNVNFDCDTCKLKPICDEVEGLRELHFSDKM